MTRDQRDRIRAVVERHLIAPTGSREADKALCALIDLGPATTMLQLLDVIDEIEGLVLEQDEAA